jgi:hypothetical protein
LDIRGRKRKQASAVKSRRIRWVGYTARMGEMRNAYRIDWSGILNGRDHLEEISIGGRILKRILET